ncbi:GDP-mannose 4,6-dehydratase [Lysobacter soli]|jgi:GDP-4-dehydro-6-deoxy-D-mannose reductase|uniref:GDP-mannose 4,6-dehydratase n=1 Tax=Lysobacter soli TaxID=453783 RepID=UPI0037C70478
MTGGRLLVTGSTGFVATHVRNACAPGGELEGWEFHGNPAGWDIRDEAAVRTLVRDLRPDGVLHLAAQSFVPRSFQAPQETLEVNVVGTANLLQALSGVGFAGRMIYISSGDVYGRVPDDAMPVTEARLPEPRSPYAVSKIAAEHLCLQWHRSESLDVVVARPFNHVGPGQDARFVLPALARQIVAIERGEQPPVIDVGDIDTTRDFTDVRDVVAAYAAMLRDGVSGTTYLVASGRERRVRDLLEQMCELASVAADIHQDTAKLRPAEQRRMVADASLLTRDTGWVPKISLDTTLLDILNDARTHS